MPAPSSSKTASSLGPRSSATPTLRLPARRVADTDRSPWHVQIVTTPGGDERGLPLPSGGWTLGRDAAEATLVLGDPAVSRQHARLQPAGTGVKVTDLGSSNGTFLDGHPLPAGVAVPAEDGSVLRLGECVLLLTRGEHLEDPDDLGLGGRTPAMAKLRALLRQVGPSRLPVLIEGETGTGKELIAKALHTLAGRPGPLVPVNCAALPGTLVESALFGHRKGAFTHATGDQDGAFKTAHKGTLFLDEIGEMPVEAQPKLLRALENGEIVPVGAAVPVPVDVRVVAATNVPLDEAVQAGRFREDLLGRLAGVRIQTPPLRDRRADVLPLLRRFLPRGLHDLPMSADFAEAVLLHPWPRNVREVRQLADRLALLHPTTASWDLTMLEPAMQARVLRREAPAMEVPDAVEGPPPRDELERLLQQFGGNVTDLARHVGRSRKQVYRWMDQHGLARGSGRS